ncbi:SDR family NAD(P)-dependent oxidoreductase [Nocardia sp. NEAU-351]|uniref:SDR family NAD(P)-dependent oxidoreductase n=1 Tax=Nocardia bovistercoris TaxID=2785916 RepID=A0A931N611_9NOCA|nr:SDR family NAD(P)-dependent oxidoreductase [Nocardia bovistercoris]
MTAPPRGPASFVRHPISRAVAGLIGPRGLRDTSALRRAVRDKVVVVTGASYGVGAATARLFAAADARVVLAARSLEQLRVVADEITDAGGKAYVYPLDLTSEQSVAEFAAAVLYDFGAVDVLIHNAGKSLRRSIHLSYDRPKDLTATTGANYLGPMRLTMALLPGMRARGRGHIVNVSTVGIMFPVMPKWGFYLSSKAAFDWWMRAVAMEARADGVTTTTLYAGLMHTRMSAPSAWMRLLPGQSPSDAARVIARAVVDKPRTIAPIYGHPSAIAVPMLRWPLEVGIGFVYRFLGDTPASLASARPSPDDRFAADDQEATGDRGVAGSQKEAGDRGAAGGPGVADDRAQAGSQGEVGDHGVAGGRGVTGDRGVAGGRGVTGDRGVAGGRGVTGDQAAADGRGVADGRVQDCGQEMAGDRGVADGQGGTGDSSVAGDRIAGDGTERRSAH